ncbi:unnamed protein product [Vitrella brassicaformis CCMP3155]|uniref:Uncharacterized protein n=2 Tax=Vitrella brassicaformis TaxID=1169539 RepID=A0A0G4EMV7_VITBC|nr:unnamed protein product [Vitrella brassicaformis CCMP3155]|eukprot:CEL98149.1 unnamed protein product [Vitrella brassicaformis CCMP3155]
MACLPFIYAGNIAAFARAKFPETITGAISSSAPIEAREKYTEYDAVVEDSIPRDCAKTIRKATKILERRLLQPPVTPAMRRRYGGDVYKHSRASREARRIFDLFGCTGLPAETYDDVVDFLFIAADKVSTAVQYHTSKVRPYIDNMCRIFKGERIAISKPASPPPHKVRPRFPKDTATQHADEAREAPSFVETLSEPMRMGIIAGEPKLPFPPTAPFSPYPLRLVPHTLGSPEASELSNDTDTDSEMAEERLLRDFGWLSVYLTKATGQDCDFHDILHHEDTKLDESASQRLWMWQSCSEYEYWQVGFPHSMRSELIDVSFAHRACDHTFPLPYGAKWTSMAARENALWDGKQLTGRLGSAQPPSRIHFTNGQTDPWQILSVESTDLGQHPLPDVDAYEIPGGSHCLDFGASHPADSAGVRHARELIRERIQQWTDAHYNEWLEASSTSSFSYRNLCFDKTRHRALVRCGRDATFVPESNVLTAAADDYHGQQQQQQSNTTTITTTTTSSRGGEITQTLVAVDVVCGSKGDTDTHVVLVPISRDAYGAVDEGRLEDALYERLKGALLECYHGRGFRYWVSGVRTGGRGDAGTRMMNMTTRVLA